MVQMPMYDPFVPSNLLKTGLRPQIDGISTTNSNCVKCSFETEYHWEVIERILYIYYKTHGSQNYVQGMNEIIAPIYFVFANDLSKVNRSEL